MEVNESKVWGLVSAIQNGRADAIKDAFQETISQRIIDRIGEKREELASSMFDENGKITEAVRGYGTPGCSSCENDTYNGVCMDCTKARAKSATSGGGCSCGSKKSPSDVKSNGSRSWVSCNRCLGTIKQLS